MYPKIIAFVSKTKLLLLKMKNLGGYKYSTRGVAGRCLIVHGAITSGKY